MPILFSRSLLELRFAWMSLFRVCSDALKHLYSRKFFAKVRIQPIQIKSIMVHTPFLTLSVGHKQGQIRMLNVYANILPLNNVQRILASLQVFVELTKYVPREGIVARILSHAERREDIAGDSCLSQAAGKEKHAFLAPNRSAGS